MKRATAADKAQGHWVAELWDLGRRLRLHGLWAPMVIVMKWTDRQVRAAESWAATASIGKLNGYEAPLKPPHVAALESADAVLARLEAKRAEVAR